jgi:hypothetical protein
MRILPMTYSIVCLSIAALGCSRDNTAAPSTAAPSTAAPATAAPPTAAPSTAAPPTTAPPFQDPPSADTGPSADNLVSCGIRLTRARVARCALDFHMLTAAERACCPHKPLNKQELCERDPAELTATERVARAINCNAERPERPPLSEPHSLGLGKLTPAGEAHE